MGHTTAAWARQLQQLVGLRAEGLVVYAQMCICSVVVEWDPDKAAANLEKHGIDFADAETVLHDEMALTMPDDDDDEARWATLGMDALGRLLVVVYTWRGDDVRLISAREASKSERRQYEGAR